MRLRRGLCCCSKPATAAADVPSLILRPSRAAIVAMIMTSGLVDYLLEREAGGRVFSSMHEYAAGVLWGGFQDPHTRLSAVYQIIGAFIILVVISAYTANLASLMTIGLIPKAAVDSVDYCIANSLPACVVRGYSGQSTYEALFPRLDYLYFETKDSIDDALRDGTCAAALVPRIDFDFWR